MTNPHKGFGADGESDRHLDNLEYRHPQAPVSREELESRVAKDSRVIAQQMKANRGRYEQYISVNRERIAKPEFKSWMRDINGLLGEADDRSDTPTIAVEWESGRGEELFRFLQQTGAIERWKLAEKRGDRCIYAITINNRRPLGEDEEPLHEDDELSPWERQLALLEKTFR